MALSSPCTSPNLMQALPNTKRPEVLGAHISGFVLLIIVKLYLVSRSITIQLGTELTCKEH